MMKRCLLLFLPLVVNFSCTEKQELPAFPVIALSAPTAIASPDFTDNIEITGFVRLETDSSCQIRSIDDVYFIGSNILVLDNTHDTCHLCVFDTSGYFISAFDQDPNSFDRSGFLTQSGQEMLYNPVYNDTLFRVSNGVSTPLYVFDFGATGIPASLRSQPLRPWDVASYSYAGKHISLASNHLLFEYQWLGQARFAEYNTVTETVTTWTGGTTAANLFCEGVVTGKNAESFTLMLVPGRIENFLIKNPDCDAALDGLYPDLAGALHRALDSQTPLLISFRYKAATAVQKGVNAGVL